MTDRPRCDWYQEIGSGRCDNCGGKPADHKGMQMLKRGASPFLTDRDAWENLTWAEFNARLASDRREREARKRLADLPTDAVLALDVALAALRETG